MEDSHMPGKLAMAANANPQAKIAPFPNPLTTIPTMANVPL